MTYTPRQNAKILGKEPLIGFCKFYDRNKAYGFITCDELNEDFFFHKLDTEDIIKEGDRVSFFLGAKNGKERAVNVALDWIGKNLPNQKQSI